ncbi:MAG: CmpA/NrtA family ABC transporter substrate-binding protein [Thermoleophilia bacterium]
MRVGFVPLTDAAPVLMAQALGFYEERGLAVELVRQASWPATRDALLSGEIDAAHCLASLPLSVAAGVTGRADQVLPIVMALNTDGQAITLATALTAPGYADPEGSLAAIAAAGRARRLTLAMTYPGGTHDIWLRYWLAAAGLDPARDVDIIPIPPPQMVANIAAGTMDGFSAGEPWNAVAAAHGVGFTAITSHDILPGHPEKALVVSPGALARRRSEVDLLIGGTLAACAWLDDPHNRRAAVPILATPRHVNAAAVHIERRLLDADTGPVFHDGGRVNAPRRVHAHWFLAQMRRLGVLHGEPDDRAIVDAVVRRDVYEDAARAEGVAVPGDDMEPLMIPLDGAFFDPGMPTR